MLDYLSNHYTRSFDSSSIFMLPRINYIYYEYESSSWFWICFTIFIITLGIMVFLITKNIAESKNASKMKTSESKLDQIKTEKFMSILENNYTYLLRSGFLVLLIQNIILSIIFFFYGFLYIVINNMILDIVVFSLIHLDILAALLISISFVLTRKSFQKTEYNSISTIMWICWIITAMSYRLLIKSYFGLSTNYPLLFSRTAYYGISTILFTLSTSLFCLAVFFSAISLSENYLLNNKWFFVGFGLSNLVITNLYILSNLIPLDEGRYLNDAWRAFSRMGDFIFYFKLFGVPLIGIISLVFVLNGFKESLRSARSFFIKNNHSMSKIREKCSKVKEYRDLSDIRLDMQIEQSLQENVIDLNALEAFSSRASDYSFILFVPRNIKKLNRLIIEFLNISIAKPEIEMLFFDELKEKRHKRLHSFQWETEGSLEEIFEFNFNELPAVFIIDNTSYEIGKIEGNLSKKITLLDGLIYYLDVGRFLES